MTRRKLLPELIIAAAAAPDRMAVPHYDADFDTTAAATGQDAEWVVSREAS